MNTNTRNRKQLISLLIAIGFFLCLITNGFSQNDSTKPIADHDTLNRLLKKYVTKSGWVNYKAWAANDTDCEILSDYIDSLASKKNTVGLSPNSQMALWINAYNAITLKAILEHYPLTETASFFSGPINYTFFPSNSIKQIPGVWDDIKTRVAGRIVSLNDIEHKILRIEFSEPRIHGAINCASKGCPPLRNEAFVGNELDQQLTEQMKVFLSSEANFNCNATDGTLFLSKIFDWFAGDFQKHYQKQYGQWAARRVVFSSYLANFARSEYKTCLAQPNLKIEYIDYDWSLNGN